MSTRDRLLSLVQRASGAMEQDKRTRSALRRAAHATDALGFEPVVAFVAALKRIPAFEHLDDGVGEGGMVLMAQGNVLINGRIRGAPGPVPGLLPKLFGERIGGERRRLSELRFQRLLRAHDIDDRMRQLRRAIALLDARIHPMAVLDAWLDLHSVQGRRRFANAYFGTLETPEYTSASETSTADSA
ncbi:type I-E CRISPR-associated protein Cse2/CasB [Dokdonella fugitiva]|uniref:type I-E CRISPR-associated protein Cse2/CasB n=1 Tax=Dokdonella fugitiva TaxID=328517 RepID=UPI0015FCDE04|nr:type I-E CRISPR-associated protein Cse2/CasB [Dokdonella fugitiva]MBA8884111.1 hypothetical protein [Dokdonella fugitiva]